MVIYWLWRCWQARYPVYAVIAVTGLALIWWPWHTQVALENWARELQTSGTPMTAQVYLVEIKPAGHKRAESRTMFVIYTVNGQQRQGELGCFEACVPAGSDLPIWVNPNDPTDFTAADGTLSGSRGVLQGLVGAGGCVAAVVAIAAAISRARTSAIVRRRADDLATGREISREAARPKPPANGEYTNVRNKKGHRWRR